MTTHHHDPARRPVAPTARRACARSDSTRCGSPAGSGRSARRVNGAATPRAHRALAGARGLDRQLRLAPRTGTLPAGPRAAGSSPTPRSTSCSRPWPGRSAAPATPTLDGPVPRGRRPGRRRPGARRLPQHRTSAGPASSRASRDLEWGHELYCFGHLFQAAVARARTRPDADDGLLDVARRAADQVVRGVRPGRHRSRSAGTPEIEPALAELGRATGERALRATRPRCSSSAAGTGTLADIEFGRVVLPGRRPGARGDRPARARGAGQLPGRRRGRRRRRDRRHRPARRADHASGRTRSRAAPTSPAGRARTTRTRRSATTSCCRRTARTPRRARASAR